MKTLLRVLGLSATLTLLAMPTWAQDDEAAPEDETPAAAAPDDDAAAQAAIARRARIRARRAARRQALLQQQAAAAAETEAAAPEPAPAPLPTTAPAVRPDTLRPDSAGIDATPALAPLAGTAPPQSTKHEGHPAATAGEHAPPPLEGVVAAEHAAEGGAEASGGHPRFSVKVFILQLVNFGVLLFILIRYGGRAFGRALRAKHEQLQTDIGEATRLRDEAQQKAAAQDRRLAELEHEIAALRASMRKDAQHEQARIVEAAHERGKQLQEEMRTQIDEQVKLAAAALRGEVANASVALAEEIVRKAVSFEDERRLARELVAGFEDSHGSPGEAR